MDNDTATRRPRPPASTWVYMTPWERHCWYDPTADPDDYEAEQSFYESEHEYRLGI